MNGINPYESPTLSEAISKPSWNLNKTNIFLLGVVAGEFGILAIILLLDVFCP